MDLLILFISKYIFGYFLQEVIFVLGIYTFAKQKVDRKTFLVMLCVLIPTSIIVRILPISYGIHILINLAVILFVTYNFCHFDIYVIIRSTLLTILLILFTEILCFGSLLLTFGKERADFILQDPLLKAVIYMPFNICFGLFIYFFYRKMLKKHY